MGQNLVIWAITGLPFPLSFIMVTVSIVLYAWIIHMISAFIQRRICKIAECCLADMKAGVVVLGLKFGGNDFYPCLVRNPLTFLSEA